MTEQKNKTGNLTFLLSKDIRLFGIHLSDKKKERFYSELNILLLSGVDIRTALEIIYEEQTSANDAELFQSLHDELINGLSLSECMLKTKQFSAYEYYSIRIGEESGQLSKVLKELGVFYDRKVKQRRQITGALTYPLLVLLTALGAVFFMLRVVVPMFQEVFKRFKGELPPLTKFVMNLSDHFSFYFVIFFVTLSAFVISTYLFRKEDWYRALKSRAVLGIPYMGKVFHKIYLARFCQAMALLTGAQTPLVKALQLTRDMIQFYPFEKALIKIEDDILHGKLLNQSMAQFRIFDRRVVSLTRVAEEVNQLDTLFSRLNEQYTEELEHELSVFGNILEPFLIVIVGLLVAVIVISMYLPLFQLGTNIV